MDKATSRSCDEYSITLNDNYLKIKRANIFPKLPLEGNIDLTYRCNNHCRHCWLRIPANVKKKEELSFEEIKKIVDDAREMGCRRWSISGGEPMLRPDFPDIFKYITANSASCTINTNGTLITPKIACILKKKGLTIVSLYGADAKVHDHITRNPGSFEAAMRGLSYLKGAGAGFTVQIVPMKDNYHQFKDMLNLAKSLSKHYKIGAAWLYLSACGDIKINNEILNQRLPPEETYSIILNQPNLFYEDWMDENSGIQPLNDDSYLFSSCIDLKRDFHIDPYGKTSFCCYIKNPALRYDLRRGNFREYWDKFIPSLAKKVKVNWEYRENCGNCDLRKDCCWCPAYGYLEHGRFTAKIDYLCRLAKENRKFKENWLKEHRQYYAIAGITIQVKSDLPIKEDTFNPKFRHFEVSGPGEDMISLWHHFSLPDLKGRNLGEEIYRRRPWVIHKKGDSWIYLWISPNKGDKILHRVAFFDSGYTQGCIHSSEKDFFLWGNLDSLSLLPTDQIILAHVLAERQGCYLHSCGVNLNGKGLLFVGRSESGKSTMATLLKGKAEILCDERIIVRRLPDGFKIYGTWSHGTVSDISAGTAPLKTILFLNKSQKNRLVLMDDKKEINRRLLSCLIRPLITKNWWEKMLSLIEDISNTIPCYELYFDKGGKVIDMLKKL